jgi:hypothetical protein
VRCSEVHRERRRAASLARGRARLAQAFDAEAGLVAQVDAAGVRHLTVASLDYARCLLHTGDAPAVAEAARILEALLAAQELRLGHPHRGAFRFGLEDAEVTGLNVVSFVLLRLATDWDGPIGRLPATLQAVLLDRVRLALAALQQLHVHPCYTNAALMEVTNAILWGERLDDAALLAHGSGRFNGWLAATGAGAPYEYNSPAYLATDLTVLATLGTLAADPAVRLKARVMEERLWLHGLLHYHAATGRQAGPHARAYHAQMHGAPQGLAGLLWQELGLKAATGGSPYIDGIDEPGDVWTALTAYHCPPHLAAWVDAQEHHYPYTVQETAAGAPGTDLTTYLTADYALGTASRTYTIGQRGYFIEHQANYCLLHYRHHQPGETTTAGRAGAAWRTLYTRFVTNQRYLGTIRQHAIGSARTNFYDQGLFAGHQQRDVAIALYGLELGEQALHSVEALVVLPGPVRPDAVFVGGRQVGIPEATPLPVPDNTWVIVQDGAVWVGLWPLQRDHLGEPQPLELRLLPTDELVLAMPQFRSPEPKWFWEYESEQAAFYRRNIRSGFLIVVGEAARYANQAAFAARLARATIADELAGDGTWTVGYRADDAWLSLTYDLVRNRPVARLVDGQPLVAPALASPWAVAASGGEARLGEAVLQTGDAPAVLLARDALSAPRSGPPWVWEATRLANQPGPVRLTTSVGTVACPAFGFGSILVEASEDTSQPAAIHLRATAIDAPVALPAPRAAQPYPVTLNGVDVTRHVTPSGDGASLVLERASLSST